MDFDLRTCDSALVFLSKFLNMKGEDYVKDYIGCDGDFEVFWEKHFKEIDAIDISNLRIIGFHVVGSLDKCREIKKNGLKNLKKVLSQKTILNKFLRENGVRVDVKSKRLYYKGVSFDIDYEKYKERYNLSEQEKKIQKVANRIYCDFCVNGFMVNDDVFNYGTNIHKRPEFIKDLVALLPDLKNMEDKWCEQSISYKINFYSHIKQMPVWSFNAYGSYDDYELTDEQKIKKWLLYNAIKRADDELSKTILYVKNDVDIPPEQILTCIQI